MVPAARPAAKRRRRYAVSPGCDVPAARVGRAARSTGCFP